MFILFSLIVMRMSGAVGFNPVFGRTNIPTRVRAIFIFGLSLLLYVSYGGVLYHEPQTMVEFAGMLLMELLFGAALGFAMELSFLVVRFASSIMDYAMGLTMAQIYDPQYNTQMTITSGMYYAFLVLLFLAMDGHIRLIELFYQSARIIPFGTVTFRLQLPLAILNMFRECILMGLQFAFPVVAMELVSEAAVGILMRVIPQVNVFVVNFQVKIIVGMMMLLFLFSPMSDKMYVIIEDMFRWMEELAGLMA